MKALRLPAISILLLALGPSLAQTSTCVPAKPAAEVRLVYQFTPLLDDADEQRLDAKLVRFARETSNQIAVVIVDTLCGDEPYAVAHAIMRDWGIGQAKEDNGIVVLVKPTGPPGSRKVFIATGYGLEGAIPDALARRIVDNLIIPRFKEGQFFTGLDNATDDLMKLAIGEYNAGSYGEKGPPWQAIVMILIFLVAFIALTVGRAKRYARTNNIDMWTAFWLLSQMNNRHRGRWGGFTGGGGGFGGFGGGMGGGGGAGGSW